MKKLNSNLGPHLKSAAVQGGGEKPAFSLKNENPNTESLSLKPDTKALLEQSSSPFPPHKIKINIDLRDTEEESSTEDTASSFFESGDNGKPKELDEAIPEAVATALSKNTESLTADLEASISGIMPFSSVNPGVSDTVNEVVQKASDTLSFPGENAPSDQFNFLKILCAIPQKTAELCMSTLKMAAAPMTAMFGMFT